MVFKEQLVHIDDKSAKDLSAAIVTQAVTDYMDALIRDDDTLIRDCELFFRGKDGWFSWLSDGMNGDIVVERVNRKAKEFVKACLQCLPKYGDEEAAEKAAFRCPCCGGTVKIHFGGNPIGRGRMFTEYYNYNCDTCTAMMRIKYNKNDHGRRLKTRTRDVLTNADCAHCNYYQPVGSVCTLKEEHTNLVDVCKEWENRMRWRSWLVRGKY